MNQEKLAPFLGGHLSKHAVWLPVAHAPRLECGVQYREQPQLLRLKAKLILMCDFEARWKP